MSRQVIGERLNSIMTSQVTAASEDYRVGASEWWLSLRLGALFCRLPLFLRLYSLPHLLQRLTPLRMVSPPPTNLKLDHVVGLVLRICEFRPFRTRFFPRACMRQALALYYTLTYLGYAVTIHFGIHRRGKELRGHSWVTLNGQPVAEKEDPAVFHIVYSHSSHQPDVVPDVNDKFSSEEQFL